MDEPFRRGLPEIWPQSTPHLSPPCAWHPRWCGIAAKSLGHQSAADWKARSWSFNYGLGIRVRSARTAGSQGHRNEPSVPLVSTSLSRHTAVV